MKLGMSYGTNNENVIIVHNISQSQWTGYSSSIVNDQVSPLGQESVQLKVEDETESHAWLVSCPTRWNLYFTTHIKKKYCTAMC